MMRKNKTGKKAGILFLTGMLLFFLLLSGCGNGKDGKEGDGTDGENAAQTAEEGGVQGTSNSKEAVGIAGESAKDAAVDFAALQAENPDIFAWLYIPDTGIDYPVLQSEEADDYYETHDAFGNVSDTGAVYTELANLRNMCDFNTVLHGKTAADGENGLFAGLYRFADPDYFDSHEYAYLYLDGNVLTYEIFAAYERENTSLIRTYDFTYKTGCQQFIDDLYDTRIMGMNIRDGWKEERVTPYHFLITLTTVKDGDPEKQFVVVAALVSDAAGTIDRLVE